MADFIPQAFPCLDSNEYGLSMRDPGMDLRDWFAGQALSGFLASESDEAGYYTDASHAADRAYEIAEAMIKRRATPTDQETPNAE